MLSRKTWGVLAAALMLALVAAPAPAADIDLGTAGAYSAFILYDMNVRSNQSYGSYAVGGDAKMQSYTVGYGAGSSDTTLVVGGNLKSNIDPVATGNVEVGGKAKLPGWVDRSHIKEGVTDLPVNFSAEQKYLQDLSQTLALMEATGSSEYKWGGIYLSGDGTSEVQVFNISGDELSSATWWATLSSIPDDSWIILNISGSDVSMSGGQQALYDWSDKILFNFYEAEQLALSSITVSGSILAPYADVLTSGVTVDGNLIAKSIEGSFSTTGDTFQAYHGGGAAAPEPGSMLLFASALGGVGGMAGWSRWRLRRRERQV